MRAFELIVFWWLGLGGAIWACRSLSSLSVNLDWYRETLHWDYVSEVCGRRLAARKNVEQTLEYLRATAGDSPDLPSRVQKTLEWLDDYHRDNYPVDQCGNLESHGRHIDLYEEHNDESDPLVPNWKFRFSAGE